MSRTVPGQIHMVVVVVVLMMGMKKILQQFNDFIIWVNKVIGVETKHLGDNHAEIDQLKNGHEKALLVMSQLEP